ncbi:MAG: hypothetical protein PHT51_04665 [Patescibacteria group bacterium]|nr:hypothetical protein [Patescibacteria group bacterium]MDD4610966.1 hypothetical protein [Patescibacteria group bacterium]
MAKIALAVAGFVFLALFISPAFAGADAADDGIIVAFVTVEVLNEKGVVIAEEEADFASKTLWPTALRPGRAMNIIIFNPNREVVMRTEIRYDGQFDGSVTSDASGGRLFCTITPFFVIFSSRDPDRPIGNIPVFTMGPNFGRLLCLRF